MLVAAPLLGLLAGGIAVAVALLIATPLTTVIGFVILGLSTVEYGNHEELIADHGLYAELFELQARAYR